MEGVLQQALGVSKDLAGKASPALDWISNKLGGFVDIEPTNIHLLILLALSLWVSAMVFEDRGIKFWIIGVSLFLFLKYVGL